MTAASSTQAPKCCLSSVLEYPTKHAVDGPHYKLSCCFFFVLVGVGVVLASRAAHSSQYLSRQIADVGVSEG